MGGVVKTEQIVISEAEILSEGVAESTGAVLVDGDQVKYFTSSASDIKTTIESLVDAIQKIAAIATSIGAGMTGPTTAPPPTLAADVIELTAIAAELTTLKENLK